jgi:hypothetical protein
LQTLQAHTLQDSGRLRELNVAVLDELHLVAPGIAKVDPAAGKDLDARRVEGGANDLSIVDDQPEVAVPVRRLGAALGQGDELVPDVDEGHSRHMSAQLALEDPPVERERLLEVADLQGDVVEADEPGALGHAFTLATGAMPARRACHHARFALTPRGPET